MNLLTDQPPPAPDLARLREWGAVANLLFAPGCEAQSAALLASFAAPLMALAKFPECGLILSLIGGPKSGKRTTMLAAASVWGKAEDLTIDNYFGAARFARLTELGNLPPLSETLTRTDRTTTGWFLDDFTKRQRGEPEWRTVLINAGTTPLFEDGTAGLEIPLTIPKAIQWDKDAARRAEFSLITHEGTAGAAYQAYLVTQPHRARQVIGRSAGKMARECPKVPEHAAHLIALIHAAGTIVSDLGILECAPERITAWLTERATGEAALLQSPRGKQ